MTNDINVPVFRVFCFNVIKKPIICALWYAVLIHIIFEPLSTTSILISSAILALSIWAIRFFFAVLSPIPMIASVVISIVNHFETSVLIVLLFFAIIWTILYVIALFKIKL